MTRFLAALICATLTAMLVANGKLRGATSAPVQAKTVLDLDREFDGGSRITIRKLTNVQIENLATLGKVWGFLKYYHPAVTSGQRQWDYELFRVLPRILKAHSRARVNAVFLHWIVGLGPVVPCNPCAKLDANDLKFGPDLDWIGNATLLGTELSGQLQTIRDNRSPSRQFYVSNADVGNPSFDHELGYPGLRFPDSGYQLLSLYRFWNIIEYWSPYRDVLGEDWNAVLAEFIPRITTAENAEAYARELLALLAKAHDGHAQLSGSIDARPPMGTCRFPFGVRFVENVPLIIGFSSPEVSGPEELKFGDVITELDRVSVGKLVETWKPYYPASNDAQRMRNIARFMTRGECTESDIGVRRENHDFHYRVKRVPAPKDDPPIPTHDLPGPAFRLLSKDVAYLKLSSAKAADVAHYVEGAAGTKGLIIDIRNYPSEFVVFALGSLLVDGHTAFSRFTLGDLSNPGAFHWKESLFLNPQEPHYSGKIVTLVDDISVSQAEFTAMAFRAVREAIVVGSSTAGADGGVSRFDLPGGLHTQITGTGVFYPDKTPTQRVGIKPDIEIRPTIAGIRAGRDEVLDEGIRQIVGREVSPAEIEKMAKP